MWDKDGHAGTVVRVDDGPYIGDLDLGTVSTRVDLAALLRQVHIRADKPSLRALEAKTRHGNPPLSKTVVAEMLNGKRFPRKAVLVAFLRACGVRESDLESWQRTWERVASGEAEVARPRNVSGSIGRLGPAPSATQQPQQVSEHDERKMQVRKTEVDEPAPENAASAETAEINRLREQVQRLARTNEQIRSQLAANQRSWPEDPADRDASSSQVRRSMWHFPDAGRVTLVSYRLPPDERPPSADPSNPNYARYTDLADLDALIDIYGAVRAHNPMSRVAITAAQDLTQRDVATHLVLIGGLTWQAVTPWFSRIFSIPIEAGDPYERGAIVVRDRDDGEREFRYTSIDDEIVEDVGFFACGKNPSAPRRKLTICGGVTTRGVHGAALCFIDQEMKERNEHYLKTRLAGAVTYCIVMRVPILNKNALTPDLSKKENRLFEWCDTSSEDDGKGDAT